MRWILPANSSWRYSELFNQPTNTLLLQADIPPEIYLGRYTLSDGSVVFIVESKEPEGEFASLWYERYDYDHPVAAYNLGFTAHKPYKIEVQKRYNQLRKWAEEELEEKAKARAEWEMFEKEQEEEHQEWLRTIDRERASA